MDFLSTPADPVEAELLRAAQMVHVGIRNPPELIALRARAPGAQLRAVAAVVTAMVRSLVDRGWRPHDLAQIRARRLGAAAGACLFDVLSDLTTADARLRVDAGWLIELREVRAGEAAGTPRPDLTTAAPDPRWPVDAAVDVAVELLGVLMMLPRLPTATPLRSEARASDADTAMLLKVRALLAKAERTEFEHEADAFTAKAQQLMARHSIDEAMIGAASSSGPSGAPGTAVHRIWLESPYVRAKFSLVAAVAQANRCEAFLNTGLEVATVVGMASDVRATVLLTTSLQLQAARAVAHARPDPDDEWVTSVRAYRRGFLVAFAVRIGERLREATAAAEADIDPGALLPVLADRTAVVKRAVAEAFPRTKTLRTSPVDASGWAAGRAAADLARLGGGAALKGTG